MISQELDIKLYVESFIYIYTYKIKNGNQSTTRLENIKFNTHYK